MAQSDHLFHLCRRLTTFLIEYGAYIWPTVYQREDYGFYKSASREVEGAVLFFRSLVLDFFTIGCHTVGVRKNKRYLALVISPGKTEGTLSQHFCKLLT